MASTSAATSHPSEAAASTTTHGHAPALHKQSSTADAAEATAEAARAAGSRDAPALTEHARTARRACSTSYHGGYGIAASAAGDSFFPAGFTEFSGWGKSAR